MPKGTFNSRSVCVAIEYDGVAPRSQFFIVLKNVSKLKKGGRVFLLQ